MFYSSISALEKNLFLAASGMSYSASEASTSSYGAISLLKSKVLVGYIVTC